MDDTPQTGRQALAHLLDSRQITMHFGRLMLAVGASQFLAQWSVNRLVATDGRTPPFLVESSFHVGLAIVSVALFSGRTIRRELLRTRDIVVAHEQLFEERNAAERFLRDVSEAFEMSEHEPELCDAAAIALRDATTGHAELLVADASNAHLSSVAVGTGRAAPGCGVVTPSSCPAVRRGRTMQFDEPNGLAACPRLRERELRAGSCATCIPVTVLGSPTAVLHVVWEDEPTAEPPARDLEVERLEGVAMRFGSRLGMLLATARSRVQADTDPLTGLLNRRAFENRVRVLVERGTPYSLAMIDLDHFKRLNDVYGHDTGDRALRLFSAAMRSALRDEDLIGRHGGEEFVVVVPNTDVASSAPAMHRIRERLAAGLTASEVPAFTCSIGLVDSSNGSDLTHLTKSADQALMTAKREGRDRIVIADEVTVTGVAMPEATARR